VIPGDSKEFTGHCFNCGQTGHRKIDCKAAKTLAITEKEYQQWQEFKKEQDQDRQHMSMRRDRREHDESEDRDRETGFFKQYDRRYHHEDRNGSVGRRRGDEQELLAFEASTGTSLPWSKASRQQQNADRTRDYDRDLTFIMELIESERHANATSLTLTDDHNMIVLYLDSCAPQSTFGTRNILSNIRKAQFPLTLSGVISGHSISIKHTGSVTNFPEFGMVRYSPDIDYNILATIPLVERGWGQTVGLDDHGKYTSVFTHKTKGGRTLVLNAKVHNGKQAILIPREAFAETVMLGHSS